MTGRGQFVEVQSSGEETTFSGEQLQSLLALAQKARRNSPRCDRVLTKHLLKF